MSTLAVNSITDANAGNIATINGMTPTADSLQGFRNRIINGDMRIDQRNAGASVTPTLGSYSLDRWIYVVTQSSKLTSQRSTTAPSGFVNSLLVTSSSAYSVVTGDIFNVAQRIEGSNTADLAWGTADAKTVTLSFWVRSSLTGTFGGSLRNSAADRSYPFTYSISAANTWEQKTVTIPGDTTGTWLTNNGIGINVGFSLGTGATYISTAGAWASGNYLSATGETSVVGTSGATWYITGVQLEVGSVATPFERRPYGMELQLCQRYYEVLYYAANTIASMGQAITTSRAISPITWTVIKRATPTLFAATGTFGSWNANAGSANTGTNTLDAQTVSNCRFDMASISGAPLVTGNASGLYASTACTITISSEL